MTIKIAGNWKSGLAFDVHTLSSTYFGPNEFGHDQWENVRSEMGELVYKLKYRNDRSALEPIIALLDKIKGIEFGPRPSPFDPPQAGELPQINTFGFAVSPVFTGIRYTIALDVVDFTRTVLPGKDWKKRSRLGVEMGIGPRRDGTALLAILAGLNASHFSFGGLSRVWIYEIGFGSYTVELGNEAGDKPSDRFAFIFGFRF